MRGMAQQMLIEAQVFLPRAPAAVKALFYTALAVAAWRIARDIDARLSVVDAGKAKEAFDAENKYGRAIQRWENEGGKTVGRTRAARP